MSRRGTYGRPERIIDAETGETARTVTFHDVIAPKRPRSKRRAEDGGPLAIFVVLKNGDEWWIPRSQILPESQVNSPGDMGTLVVTMWFCQLPEQAGLLRNPGATIKETADAAQKT